MKLLSLKIRRRGGNRINTKGRDHDKSHVERLKNLKSCIVNKSKENITRESQDLWWCPNHNIEGKFDGMYMSHLANKHNEWVKTKQRNI